MSASTVPSFERANKQLSMTMKDLKPQDKVQWECPELNPCPSSASTLISF